MPTLTRPVALNNNPNEGMKLLSSTLRHPALCYSDSDYRAEFCFNALVRYGYIPAQLNNVDDDTLIGMFADVIDKHTGDVSPHVSYATAHEIAQEIFASLGYKD